jgi:hypothetical protein
VANGSPPISRVCVEPAGSGAGTAATRVAAPKFPAVIGAVE